VTVVALRAPAPRTLRRRRALARNRAADRTLHRLAESTRPIVAGPWVGDVGLELLYWIPLLQWLTHDAGVDPSRIIAVSRAGADPWYADVSGRYIDLLDHYGQRKLYQWRKQRAPHDRRAFELARKTAGESDAHWLHPSIVNRLFEPRWRWNAGAGLTREHTLHRPLAERVPPPGAVEQPYVAVAAHFTESFPSTNENWAFLERLIGELAARTTVALLWEPGEIEDYEPFVPAEGTPGHVLPAPPARQNLWAQTEIVRHAEVFLSPYGGLSFLGPYVETPTVAFYSKAGFPVVHLDEIERVGRQLAPGQTRLFRARHVGHLSVGAGRQSD
jgi:hypothetical protein